MARDDTAAAPGPPGMAAAAPRTPRYITAAPPRPQRPHPRGVRDPLGTGVISTRARRGPARPPLTSGCISARTAGTWNRSISSIILAAAPGAAGGARGAGRAGAGGSSGAERGQRQRQ